MLWVTLAFLSSFAYTAQTELNRGFQCNGFVLNTYRAGVSALMLVPFVFFMEWPSDPRFYLLVGVCSAVAIVCLMTQYNMAATSNGRVANMHLPINIFITFFAWLALDPQQLKALMGDHTQLGFILLSFVILVVSLQFIRRNDAGWRTLMVMVPIGVLYAFINTMTKYVLMDGQTLLAISLTFVLVSNVLQFLFSFPVHVGQNLGRTPLFDKGILKQSLIIGFLHTASWILFSMCMILTPNPAYPVVITALNPVWFMVYYKMRGIEDHASPYAGAMMVLSAIILLLATS